MSLRTPARTTVVRVLAAAVLAVSLAGLAAFAPSQPQDPAVVLFLVVLGCSVVAVGSAYSLLTGDVHVEPGPVILLEGVLALLLAMLVVEAPF